MSLVSVVISVHNGQEFISKALDSVLQQSYNNYEILISDDGSNDKTLKIIKKYKKKFPNKVKIFNNRKTIGLTKSLIQLINYSKGEFIARLDADDMWDKNLLKIHINWLSKRKKNVLIGSSGFKINTKNEIIGKFNLKNLGHTELKKKLLFKNYLLHSSTMFRKKNYYEVGGYNTVFKFSQDYDLWYRLSNVGKIQNLSENLVYIRSSNSSITSRYKTKQSLYAFIISCIHKENLNININKNLIIVITKLRKIVNKIHFNSMCYLYSEYLPKKFSKKFSDLDFFTIFYLLKDKKFFFRTIIKKFLLK